MFFSIEILQVTSDWNIIFTIIAHELNKNTTLKGRIIVYYQTITNRIFFNTILNSILSKTFGIFQFSKLVGIIIMNKNLLVNFSFLFKVINKI